MSSPAPLDPGPPAPAWEADGLRLHVLASGSKGNASVVECPDGLVLVDAGISSRQIEVRMAALGLDPARVRAIVVTHEHTDHIGGLRVAAAKFHVPVYASDGTRFSETWKRSSCPAAEPVERGRAFEVCGVRVVPFAVPHDAIEPLGFRFERAGDAVGYCTDLGQVTPEAAEGLGDVRILALESNHDPAMLAACDRYPAHLKARIGGNAGHLSNPQAAAALAELVTARTQSLVAMHLSQHTNLPSVCRAALLEGRRLLPPNQNGLAIAVASQVEPRSFR